LYFISYVAQEQERKSEKKKKTKELQNLWNKNFTEYTSKILIVHTWLRLTEIDVKYIANHKLTAKFERVNTNYNKCKKF